ncbi:type I restriction enzyme S subunit [Cerasibacillus quisquiliarum]|uniref:Restriction endonuclease subunit S n=1 Tax=Cerasibacillus quisquiliarum TaxID=227865 RepID=A0A511V095_9BACI|nr:restriction endonuclease subunit S [Cerasibacillus quisquiliarum]MBB5147500.1 type I restriction enzyme S subunit [Cerasibacillus quisquiliarum]GEN32334.1 restriction endonuclease subunit S [Cerasibacillus quisquiliarum]
MAVIYKKLGEIADISSGGTPKRTNPAYWKNGNIPWVKISDIKGKYLEKTEEFITEEGLNNSSAKLFKKGTLLYTIFATIGECAILNIDASTNQAIAGINVKSEKVLNEYLYYFLKSIKNTVVNTGRGVAQNNINLSILKNIDVPLPEIEVQNRIINLLNKSNELVKKCKAQIEALDQLTQSVFLEMFGDPYKNPKNWPVGTIKDITLKTQYGTSKKASENKGKYPILRMGNITYNGFLDFNDMKYIDLDDSEAEKYLVHKGDLLFNRTNSKELVGKTAVYREELPMAYAGYLVKLVPNEKANSEFISGFLNSKYGKTLLYSMAKNIVGMANINAEELKRIKIYIPPRDLQDKFASIISNILERRELLNKGLKLLEENYNSLMQRAFKGELFTEEKVSNL